MEPAGAGTVSADDTDRELSVTTANKDAAVLYLQQPSGDTKSSTYGDAEAQVAAITIKQAAARDDAASITTSSIYEVFSQRRRALILATVSLSALLVPLCDTIYLPALLVIEHDFNTSAQLVAASVALYMFALGITSLLWGPASDRFGRRIVYLVGTAAFIATSIVCIFAPSIGVLVGFRALQGAAVAAYAATGSGVVADVFAPSERGMALGISTIPMLLGPILGPLLGGGLSQAFGWRSTFITVSAFAGIVILPLLLLVLPETHQYKTLRRLHKQDPQAAAIIVEAPAISSTKPVFKLPTFPLAILLERDIILHALVTFTLFASMFCSITELPLFLAAPPYSLSPSAIGLCYLPGGIAGLIASPIGGKLSDRAAASHPGQPLIRLIWSNTVVGVLAPVSLAVYGWVLHFQANLALVLVAQFFIGCCCSFYLPGAFGYLTSVKQQAAAAAAAGFHSMMFIASGVLILVASAAAQAIGIGPFFSLLAGLVLLTFGMASVQIFKMRARAVSQLQLMPDVSHGDASV